MLHLSASLPSHHHHQIRTNQCFGSATCNNINIYLHLMHSIIHRPSSCWSVNLFCWFIWSRNAQQLSQAVLHHSTNIWDTMLGITRRHSFSIFHDSWFEKSLPIVCGPLLSCCLSICLSRNLPFRYLDSSSQLRLCWARGSLPSQIRQLVGQD